MLASDQATVEVTQRRFFGARNSNALRNSPLPLAYASGFQRWAFHDRDRHLAESVSLASANLGPESLAPANLF
jgi:hypothetical protein